MRLHTTVRQFMPKSILILKTLITNFALIQSGVRVRFQVPPHVMHLRERLSANGTRKRSHIRMQLDMRVQQHLIRKLLAALVAQIRPIVRFVHEHVPCERTFAEKAPIAHLAFMVAPLSALAVLAMHVEHVQRDGALVVEALLAKRALHGADRAVPMRQ